MANVSKFFDELQERVKALYEEKVKFDKLEALAAKRTPGELDKDSLFMELGKAHDEIRGLKFHLIQSQQWQGETYARLDGNVQVRDLYDIYNRMIMDYGDQDIIEYAAVSIANNPVQRLEVFSANGSRGGRFDEMSKKKAGEEVEIYKSIRDILKLRSFLVFLFAISQCRMHLPLATEV